MINVIEGLIGLFFLYGIAIFILGPIIAIFMRGVEGMKEDTSPARPLPSRVPVSSVSVAPTKEDTSPSWPASSRAPVSSASAAPRLEIPVSVPADARIPVLDEKEPNYRSRINAEYVAEYQSRTAAHVVPRITQVPLNYQGFDFSEMLPDASRKEAEALVAALLSSQLRELVVSAAQHFKLYIRIELLEPKSPDGKLGFADNGYPRLGAAAGLSAYAKEAGPHLEEIMLSGFLAEGALAHASKTPPTYAGRSVSEVWLAFVSLIAPMVRDRNLQPPSIQRVFSAFAASAIEDAEKCVKYIYSNAVSSARIDIIHAIAFDAGRALFVAHTVYPR